MAHPTPDVLTSADFQKRVITYFVAHCLVFPVAADNINPASDGKYIHIYAQLQKRLHSIQSQLSDSCAATMESIFTEEAILKHPLKPLRIWKRMSSRFHQISQKDRGACMTAVQMHASHIGAWELDDLEDWMKKMEILRQDLIRSGHTEAIADDCIVSNLLHALIEVPSGSAHSEHWKRRFAARTWKADHSKNHDATWLILKTSMLDEIKELRADEVKHGAARPSKRAKAHVPTGMALVAQASIGIPVPASA